MSVLSAMQASFISRARLPLSAMLVATAVLSTAPTVLAQDEEAAETTQDNSAVAKSLADFIHYVLIGKADLAQAAGEAVLSASVSDGDLAEVVDGGEMGERLARAVSRSRAMGGVSDIATRIEDRVETGRRALARDPQRIGQAIEMLSKTLRERRLGEERLAAAGEYAVPQLLKVLVDAKDPSMELAVTKSLVSMKRLAVAPLGLALNSLDPASQRKVVGVLAEIGWPTALPFIVDLAARPSTTVEVKAACDAAYNQLGGTTRDVTAQYTALARKYFDRESSLLPYADDSVNNIWSHDDDSGFGSLSAEQVATSVYADSMAMLLARRALTADAANSSALAIFVASDLRRENTLGSDFKAGRYSPQFFATASGPSICNEVLGMAIDARDSALIRDAIAVLSQTAGGNALVSTGGRTPILEALSFSDRRVRIDAALALAVSAPTQSFAGDFRVVPTLAAAVGDSSVTRAAVLGGSNDDRRAISEQLTQAGFAPVASGASFADLENDVVRSEGVDIVVVRGAVADLAGHVARVRASGLTAATPVVVIAGALEDGEVRRSFSSDRGVVVWTEGASSDTFRSAANAAMSAMSGSALSEDESMAYAAAAASALRGVAGSNSKIFSIADAEPALLKALETKSGGLRLMIADVLSVSKSVRAQGALIDAALAASGEEQVALCDYAAQASRMTGGKAEARQMAALRELIGASEGAVADAAGRLYGALDGGSAEAVKLITGK
ncbi:MAG: hypothetical protein RIS45_819 [Planctomycetota bacterium]